MSMFRLIPRGRLVTVNTVLGDGWGINKAFCSAAATLNDKEGEGVVVRGLHRDRQRFSAVIALLPRIRN